MHIGFNASPRASVGVEVELELVDEDSRELTSRGSELLAILGRGYPDGLHPRAKHELLESTIEIITGVCADVPQARADLAETLAEVQSVAREAGVRLMCSGTHPFSRWSDQQITPNPRYLRLVNEVQWPARRLQIFGIHVHVGVRSGERAIALMNALCGYIPHLLALSASSPYWMGDDTGLASCRSKVFESLPTAGVPLPLKDWAEFEQFMSTLIAAKALTSIREVWWDIRPHPYLRRDPDAQRGGHARRPQSVPCPLDGRGLRAWRAPRRAGAVGCPPEQMAGGPLRDGCRGDR